MLHAPLSICRFDNDNDNDNDNDENNDDDNDDNFQDAHKIKTGDCRPFPFAEVML